MSKVNKIIWLIILVLIAICLTYCSPVKRLERFQRNHPYLFESVVDTLTIRDTISVTIPGTEQDTILSIQKLKQDTVYIYKKGIKTTVFIQNDSLHIIQKTDTVKVLVPFEKTVYVNKYQSKVPVENWRNYLPIIIALLLFILIIVLYLQYKK